MSDLITVTPRGAIEAIRELTPQGINVLLMGDPGIGKSHAVQAAADQLYGDIEAGMHDLDYHINRDSYYKEIRASLIDAVDLRGVPYVEHGRTYWAGSSLIPADGQGLMFLDELNRAAPLVQNGFFQMLDRLGDIALPPGWGIVAAGNPEGSGVSRFDAALSRRFTHYNLIPDNDEWLQWAITHDIDPLIVAFIQFRPGLLCEYDRNERVSPNPRSWAKCSQIVRAHLSQHGELAAIAGTVGHGASIEFASFTRLYRNLPNIDGIILSPDTSAVPGNDDVATLYAVCAAVARKADDSNIDRCIRYLERIPAEYSVFAVKSIIDRDPTLQNTKAFGSWCIDHRDSMRGIV